MSSSSTTKVENAESVRSSEQLALAVQHSIGTISDELVRRAEEIGDLYNFKNQQESAAKSPLRNVLAVAMSPTSSKKVIQNFILYQAGRGQSKFWLEKSARGSIGECLVQTINELDGLVDQVAKEVQRILEHTMTEEEKQPVRMRIIQLFLGYLIRHHAASVSRHNK